MNFKQLGLFIWEEQFPDLHRDGWDGPKSQEKLLPLPSAPGWIWNDPKPSPLFLLTFPQGLPLLAVSKPKGCVGEGAGMLSPGFSRKGPWCWQ